MTSSSVTGVVRLRPRAAMLLVVAVASLVTGLGDAPASAAASAETDHQQVIDITFPFAEGTAVRFTDDYDACRSSGCERRHQSTDLMVALGTPVFAVQGGTVSWMSGSEDGPPSYGWMLYVQGDDGRRYGYIHLGTQDGARSSAYAGGVEPGARIERGALLGWAGCSGTATCGGGEHLHLEIHDDRLEDPYDYHDHELLNPYPSLMAALRRGDHGGTPVDARRFRDVEPGSRHERDILNLADHGITRGCGERAFCPTDAVTRAQMASFLVRALDLELSGDDDGFRDVPASNVHRRSIAALAAAGITRGCGGDGYCPDDAVTRQQMASFLVRALDLPAGEGNPFDDVTANNKHARDIAALAAAGITRGCGTGSFCPDEPVTRQQMASFLVRALDL